MISKIQVITLCPDKKAIYQNLQRNGLYTPSFKTPMMTIKFMRGCIFKTTYWLPKTTEISIF